MRMLAIDCATEACSVALFDGQDCLAHEHVVLGRGHAEQLVPMIARLPERGRAERICVSLGPGSFTGVRIGIAAARALGIAWGAEVAGYPTLSLVAAMAREIEPGGVTVCMSGGHGEWFVQDFGADGLPESALASLDPASAVRASSHGIVAGSQARQLAELAPPGKIALELLPDAARVRLVPDRLFASDLRPLYGRAPDARPAR